MSDKLSWCVGVCSNALRGESGVSLINRSECWLLCFNKEEGLFANTEPVTPIQEVNTTIHTVGVILNCFGRSLLFYDAESNSGSCLCVFYDVSSNHPLVPVLGPGGRDNGVMILMD